MSKRPPKTASQAAADQQPLSKQALAVAEEGIAGIREAVKQLRTLLKTGFDAELASQLSILSHKAAQIMGEARKLEKDEAKAEVTDAAIVDHFRKMSTARRAQWIADIQAMDRKGSVL